MKRFFSLMVAVLLLAAPVSSQAEPIVSRPAVKEMSVKQLVAAAKGGIVRIETSGTLIEKAQSFSDRKDKEFDYFSTGTGFIIAGGYIVTNEHVVGPKPGMSWKERTITGEFSFELPGTVSLTGAPGVVANPNAALAGPGNFESRNWSRRTVQLVVVGVDEQSDLAVLKLAPIPKAAVVGIADESIRAMRLEAYALKFANQGGYDLGEAVVAIGFAKSIPGMPSITTGIISGLNRSVDTDSDMIQTDAPLNGGNSGGPLFNMKGEVIGVNTCVHNNAQNVSYARSSRTAAAVVGKLIVEKKIVRTDLGIKVLPLARRDVRRLRVAQGLIVTEVRRGSLAEAAGLKEGDILTQMNGESIESIGDFNFALALLGKGPFKAICQRLPQAEAKQVLGYIRGNGQLPSRVDGKTSDSDEIGTLQEIAVEFVLNRE